MTLEPRTDASGDARWLQGIGKVLSSLGFDLLGPDPASSDEATHLVAAIRPTPTLQHFDPEKIDYWVTASERGSAAVLEREGRYPVVADYAWGRISLTDRLGVKNEFLSFGGTVRAQMSPDATLYADFASNAPILRWSGHSQVADPLAAEVGAFFARLKVPIDFAPGAEALIARAAPTTLYCSFAQYVRERMTQSHSFRDANRWLAEWVMRESPRMETAVADHWKAAAELRRQLAAIETIARE
jgi:hypothetical protein